MNKAHFKYYFLLAVLFVISSFQINANTQEKDSLALKAQEKALIESILQNPDYESNTNAFISSSSNTNKGCDKADLAIFEYEEEDDLNYLDRYKMSSGSYLSANISSSLAFLFSPINNRLSYVSKVPHFLSYGTLFLKFQVFRI